jgi:hypothetical protein
MMNHDPFGMKKRPGTGRGVPGFLARAGFAWRGPGSAGYGAFPHQAGQFVS